MTNIEKEKKEIIDSLDATWRKYNDSEWNIDNAASPQEQYAAIKTARCLHAIELALLILRHG
ncbi:MAG: hypothetical protein IJR13_07745 [Bacteroidales bacterium]|nr:hypothetical protein [Bacteroidales bacterium]